VYDRAQVIRVLGGLLGLPDVRKFLLIETPDTNPLKWLVAVDHPEVSLLVLDPRLVVSDYRVPLGPEERARLELEHDREALPLGIILPAGTTGEATVNLRAPIVVNTARMKAIQLVPAESEYSVYHPLLGPPEAGA
jgi:flagellar assembly factor FliW